MICPLENYKRLEPPSTLESYLSNTHGLEDILNASASGPNLNDRDAFDAVSEVSTYHVGRCALLLPGAGLTWDKWIRLVPRMPYRLYLLSSPEQVVCLVLGECNRPIAVVEEERPDSVVEVQIKVQKKMPPER